MGQSEETVGRLYVRCKHFIASKNIHTGERVLVNSIYDWCPICTHEVAQRQKKLQADFDFTFGDAGCKQD